MENSMIILAVVVAALFIIPIVIASRARASKAKMQVKKFKLAAEKNQVHLSENEICTIYGIGIDQQAKTLFYAKGANFDEAVEVIALSSVRKAEINKITKSVESLNGIERIEIRIIFKDSGQTHRFLEFFHVDNHRQLEDELVMAERWVKIINDRL